MTKNKHHEPEIDFLTGLAKPAQRALAGAGYVRLEQFTKLSEAEVMRLHGMGPKAIEQIRRAPFAWGIIARAFQHPLDSSPQLCHNARPASAMQASRPSPAANQPARIDILATMP